MNNLKKLLPVFIILLLLIVVKNNVSFILDFTKKGSALENLQKKLAAEDKKSKYLKERLYFVKNDRFVEDQAQNKLGMLRPGEYFVIAPTTTPLGSKAAEPEQTPNWQKWLELFF